MVNEKNSDKIKVKYNLNDFRKDFNQLFPKFYLRIRDNEEESCEEKCDIAYYDGNKAFTVSQSQDSDEYILIGFPINTYKCNTSAVTKDSDKTLLDNLISICEKMEQFFDFIMPEIKYEFATSVLKNNNFDKDRFVNFEKEINLINSNILFKRDDDNCKYTFDKFNGVSDIIKVQYSFIKNIRLTNGKAMQNSIKKVEFNEFKVIAKKSNISIENITDLKDKNSFINTVKDAINSYKGKDQLEKKYQHQFLLYGNMTNLFSDYKCNILPFEQEYYIIEKSKSKYNGRIDCIFYGYKKTLLTDIFLIEIKVDDGVLGLGNGIHKHLIDIYYLKDNYFNCEADNYGKKFFENLTNRINIRREALGDTRLIISQQLKIHFYTIIGVSDITKKESVNLYLDNLNNKKSDEYKGVINQIEEYYLNDILPLKEYFEELNGKQYFNLLDKDFDIKLYVSENFWNCKNEEFNQTYINKTGEYFYNE